MNARNWLVPVVSLALIFGGCATTSMTRQVRRAPEISFKGARTVSVKLTGTCEDVTMGPDAKKLVDKESGGSSISFGISLGKIGLAEHKSECTSSSFFRAFQSRVHDMITRHLAAQGYSVVGESEAADHPLVVSLSVRRHRSLNNYGERKDRENDSTCQQSCGSPTCREYMFEGALKVAIALAGPSLPEIGEQKAERQLESEALFKGDQLVGSYVLPACNDDRARSHVAGDRPFAWNDAAAGSLGRLATAFDVILSPHFEEFKLPLYKVKDSTDTEAGLEAAKGEDWKAALAKFESAGKGLAAARPDYAEAKARLRYDEGVALLEMGNLDEARKRLVHSLATFKTDEAEALLKEIDRRLTDRLKL